jgi:sorting nexin-1/2
MALLITVSDPQKVSETLTLTTYVTYKISTSDATKQSVIRKFVDFIWLAEQLSLTLPGCIVPGLPEVQKVGMFEKDFVDRRGTRLERFLNKIANHPDMSKTDCFDIFLFGDDKAYVEARSKSVAPLSARATAWMGNKMQRGMAGPSKVFNKVISTGQKIDPDKTPQDIEFDEIEDAVLKYEAHILVTDNHCTAIIKQMSDLSSTFDNFGNGLRKLGEVDQTQNLVNVLINTGACANAYSVLTKGHGKAIELFEESVQEYWNASASIKRALNIREEARLAYLEAKANTVACRSDYYNKVSGTGNEAQMKLKLEAIERVQLAEHNAKNKLVRTSDDFIAEYERFKHERTTDLTAALMSFVTQQVQVYVCR